MRYYSQLFHQHDLRTIFWLTLISKLVSAGEASSPTSFSFKPHFLQVPRTAGPCRPRYFWLLNRNHICLLGSWSTWTRPYGLSRPFGSSLTPIEALALSLDPPRLEIQAICVYFSPFRKMCVKQADGSLSVLHHSVEWSLWYFCSSLSFNSLFLSLLNQRISAASSPLLGRLSLSVRLGLLLRVPLLSLLDVLLNGAQLDYLSTGITDCHRSHCFIFRRAGSVGAVPSEVISFISCCSFVLSLKSSPFISHGIFW